jgi:hypothetical protein
LTREHRFERGAGRKTSLGPRPGFAGDGRKRNFDGGEANLTPVVEDEAAAVVDRTNLSAAGDLEPASGRRRALGARVRRGEDDARHAAKPRKRDVPTPTHAATKPSEWGGTAAMLSLGRPARAGSRVV